MNDFIDIPLYWLENVVLTMYALLAVGAGEQSAVKRLLKKALKKVYTRAPSSGTAFVQRGVQRKTPAPQKAPALRYSVFAWLIHPTVMFSVMPP